jgi:hypothetical protein
MHKSPPVFNRFKPSKPLHKLPPAFIRPYTLKLVHKIPPKFQKPVQNPLIVPKHPEINHSLELLYPEEPNSIHHKIPPVFKRLNSNLKNKPDEDNIKNITQYHKKPPVFNLSKINDRKNIAYSLNFNYDHSLPEDFRINSEDKELYGHKTEGNDEIYDSKPLVSTKNIFISEPESIIPVFANPKEENSGKVEVSSSIESAITLLHAESQEYKSHKSSADFPALKIDYEKDELQVSSDESSYNSSDSFLETLTNDPIQSDYRISAFNHGKLDFTPTKSLNKFLEPAIKDSDASISIPTPSIYKNLSSNIEYLDEKFAFESPNIFVSGFSEISRDMNKKNSILKKSFGLDASILEKSRSISPFVTNNFLERNSLIPMKPITYFENTKLLNQITFSNELGLPVPENQIQNNFSYPSIKKGTRSYVSSINIFSENAELPFSIRSHSTLIPLSSQIEKNSKYKLKKPLTMQEIEKMAETLANDLISQ